MKNDITKLTAYEIGVLLEKRKIDPISLLELFLENYNLAEEETKRGVSKILKKEAFIEAKLSWERQKNNNRLSIFDGIPSGWKDVIDIKNYPAHGGSKLLKKIRKNIKVKDAYVVTNARRNGIIPLFKTSTVEFAFGGLGLNSSQQYPKNQMYNHLRCPGGSSSGSAATVFSNLIPIAIGTDTAGSIRIPSCWHSLIGFKPTYNNISCKGVLPLSKSYDTVGTICKTIRDSTILYNILSKHNLNLFTVKKKN
jgi:aspartyl-tRNA(Asn)/glutamyl-tRNA(Gln) amidotransferase subunit A